jgi:hypothetical protein
MKPSFVLAATLCLFLLINNSLFSQTAYQEVILPESSPDTSVQNAYEREAIYLNSNYSRYTKHGEKLRTGIFGKNLEKEFSNCSGESKNELSHSIKERKHGALLTTVGGVLMIGAAIALPVVSGPIALGALAAGLVPYSFGISKMYKGQNRLHKAIWLHNRDVVAKK